MLIIALAMGGASFLSPPLAVEGRVRFGLVALLVLLGGFVGFSAFRSFRSAETTVNPVHVERASALVSSGVYRFTRNPMYVALTSLLVAWAAYLAAPWSFLGPPVFVLFIARFQILPEERAMTAKFGAAYLEYKSRVRRWL